eukprot:1465655-Amphidinium_carterae.2
MPGDRKVERGGQIWPYGAMCYASGCHFLSEPEASAATVSVKHHVSTIKSTLEAMSSTQRQELQTQLCISWRSYLFFA